MIAILYFFLAIPYSLHTVVYENPILTASAMAQGTTGKSREDPSSHPKKNTIDSGISAIFLIPSVPCFPGKACSLHELMLYYKRFKRRRREASWEIFRFKIKEDRKIETYVLASILGGHSSSGFSHGACGGFL
jgi:hypothetical protein